MAIRWVVSAWESNVKGSTLANCFKKSCVLYACRTEDPQKSPQEKEEWQATEEGNEEEKDFEGVVNDIGELRAKLKVTIAQLHAKQWVTVLLAIDDLVVPADEEVDDPAKDLTSYIVATIVTIDTQTPDNIGNEMPHTRKTHDSALFDANKLIAYIEQHFTSEDDLQSI